jgi:hypothetical protein
MKNRDEPFLCAGERGRKGQEITTRLKNISLPPSPTYKQEHVHILIKKCVHIPGMEEP